ncbi:MAG: alkaline ceramidase [Lachnospiraceae bacterium]|nr:alkaline ceramidase [Lachnospiraceae bacterium]
MSIRVGFGEVDITPDRPAPLVGFYREDDISRGVMKPLLAQVSVWEETERCVLITIDSIGFTTELSVILRDKIGKHLGITREKVMICFSHTHAAPDAEAMEGYFDFVCEKVLKAVDAAIMDIETVVIRYGNTKSDIGVNRRLGNNNIDDRLGIIELRRNFEDKNCNDNGKRATFDERKLIILRLTAHCNCLKADNYLISPDYFGNVRETVQRFYKCHVMLIQGSAGNIAPKYFCSKNTPVDAQGPQYVRSENALQLMADNILEKLKVLDEADNTKLKALKDDVSIKMYSCEMLLKSRVPGIEEANNIAADAKRECHIDGTAWISEVRRLNEYHISYQEDKAEVQYFRIGELCLCGMAYELMTEFAILAAEKLNNEYFYLNGYTNGILSYFPTKEEYDIGGYEVYWSLLIYFRSFKRVFPFNREEADRVVEFVTFQLEEKFSN